MPNTAGVDEGQTYEDHSQVYSHIARSLAPDAAMHAYTRNSLPSRGSPDSIHGIESRQFSTSGGVLCQDAS